MAVKHGNLSINSENIFPIIKKWLYSDHDIFVRELVSNGCDAITKLKKLEVMGEYTFPEGYKPEIQVIVNPDEKTLKFIDNGIGMTADEVEKYITQIAFSGATQFLEKYKDKTTDDQMIGHFGLGFYSAFMVADEVHIDTLSYTEGAQPVHWSCDGGTEYDIQEGNKNTIGTEITLFLNEDCLEFANEYRMREILEKYCSFMPVHIYLSKANAPQEYETIDESELRDDDVVVEHIHEEAKTEEKAVEAEATAAAKTVEKPAAKKTAAKKTTTAKATAEKKAPAKRATKAAAVKTEVSVQFAGKEYTTERLVEIAKDVWQYDLGNAPEEFKSVELYVKPEESAVYYVINGTTSGSFGI